MMIAMRHFSHLLLAVGLLFAAPTLLASTDFTSPDGWKISYKAKDANDVTTWKKSIAGEPLDAFRGEIVVPHTLLEVLAVFSDIPNFSEWVFNCDSARLLPELGSDYSYVYVNGIWPVNDRDLVLRSKITQNPDTLAVTIKSDAAPDAIPANSTAVRIPRVDNRFILTPVDSRHTHITFTTLADPGGMIPAWLANFVAVKAPYVTLTGLKKRLMLPQYHITSLDQLPSLLAGTEQLVIP